MNKLIVVVFNNESKAYEGTKALRELHAEGNITFYAGAVIAKDSNGKVSVKQAVDQGPIGTVLGFATGGLIGLLGGPVGMAVGATAGTLSGSMYDMLQIGVDEDFVKEVSGYLTPGKTAVVAEIDEEWVTPLDTRMEAIGGVVFRCIRGEYIDAQIERGIAADKAELVKMKAERDQAVGEAKAKLQAKIEATQERLQTRRDGIESKIDGIVREGEAKVKSMEEQMATVKGEGKAKLQKRIAETRSDNEARNDKLRKAWQLVREAAAI
ncbi:MAG: DUF1269 domain-containing protein [Blastocatellia bacterium]|nr:DUF1269 domain-containing protein [Blastocatellia bacterium]